MRKKRLTLIENCLWLLLLYIFFQVYESWWENQGLFESLVIQFIKAAITNWELYNFMVANNSSLERESIFFQSRFSPINPFFVVHYVIFMGSWESHTQWILTLPYVTRSRILQLFRVCIRLATWLLSSHKKSKVSHCLTFCVTWPKHSSKCTLSKR